jgi:hypothetical protein
MIFYTPKVGRLIALDGAVDKMASDLYPRMVSESLQRGATEVVHHIVRDCIKTEEDPRNKLTKFHIRAVVLTEVELKDEIERAYLEGLHDARSRARIT